MLLDEWVVRGKVRATVGAHSEASLQESGGGQVLGRMKHPRQGN